LQSPQNRFRSSPAIRSQSAEHGLATFKFANGLSYRFSITIGEREGAIRLAGIFSTFNGRTTEREGKHRAERNRKDIRVYLR
jgi:hypothetical protein